MPKLKEHKHLPVILFNGKKLDAPFIDIRDLMKGGVLELKPSEKAVKAEGRVSEIESRPYVSGSFGAVAVAYSKTDRADESA